MRIRCNADGHLAAPTSCLNLSLDGVLWTRRIGEWITHSPMVGMSIIVSSTFFVFCAQLLMLMVDCLLRWMDVYRSVMVTFERRFTTEDTEEAVVEENPVLYRRHKQTIIASAHTDLSSRK